ncbi:MAG: glycosyltransferase, partial [Candidatus Hydrogenedentes bacterium]|nr:glycosyltransferase [Candidatus Hydrogenedentota bacterium]
QDPPEVIPSMIARWREGFDIVDGHRRHRKGEPAVKRAASYLWCRLMNLLLGGFPKDTGDFRLMDRSVVDAFRQYRQYNRFVRALITSTGFRQTTVDFERPPRRAGTTKYSFWRSFALGVTGLMNASVAPLRLALWVGLSIMLLSVIAIVHFVRAGLTGRTVPGWASLVVSVWFLGGIQCVLIGIVGEYVGRTFLESQRRPIYLIQETLGLDEAVTKPDAPKTPPDAPTD